MCVCVCVCSLDFVLLTGFYEPHGRQATLKTAPFLWLEFCASARLDPRRCTYKSVHGETATQCFYDGYSGEKKGRKRNSRGLPVTGGEHFRFPKSGSGGIMLAHRNIRCQNGAMKDTADVTAPAMILFPCTYGATQLLSHPVVVGHIFLLFRYSRLFFYIFLFLFFQWRPPPTLPLPFLSLPTIGSFILWCINLSASPRHPKIIYY